jgi:tetratricopeptide (TPR) repeat protein
MKREVGAQRAEGEMVLSWLQQSLGGQVSGLRALLLTWEAAAGLTICGFVALGVKALWARRRRAEALVSRLLRDTQALKEQLRCRLSEPHSLFYDAARTGPILGVSEAFERDIEAAARTVLIEAGGHRAKGKELLRVRLNEDGDCAADDGAGFNGSGVACWRQLGALSLLDDTSDAIAAYARAADLAPDDAQAQMLAGVLHLRAGSLAAAEAAFRSQINVSGTEDARVWRCRGYTMLGDVYAARNAHAEAMAAYAEAQREARAMVECAPEQYELRRDLSVTFDRIGDTLASHGALDEALANYRQALEIVEVLAVREPNNAVWLRDQSVSHDRIGDVLDRKGDFDAALQSFHRGLEFALCLASRDPRNTQWQWDLSVSHDRIGDMHMAKGRSETALKSYRRALAIAEALVASDPSNIGWRRDLAVSYHKVGTLEAAHHNPAEARDLLEKGRSIIARLERIASYHRQWRADLAKFDRALQALPG